MRILWDNEIDKYTLIFSSERSGFPATNVQHSFLTRVVRTLALADEWFIIDAGIGQTITADCAFIAAHNLTSGVTAKIQANATNDWGAPFLDVTFTWNAGTIVAYFASTAKRFWRFKFIDAANPDGYIEIGRLALGEFLQMPPIEPGIELPSVDSTSLSVSPGGQAFGDLGEMFLNPAFDFPLITDTERGYIDTMWQAVRRATPIFLTVWEDSLTVQRPIYCRIDQDRLSWRKAPEAGVCWSLQLAFMEAK